MAIMVCFDFADIFLPLAKALRYLRLGDSLDRLLAQQNALSACTDCRHCYSTDPLDDITFAVFAIAWVPTRHFLMLSILVSIVEVSPRVMSCGATIWEVVRGAMAESCPSTWDYTTGYYWNGEVMIPICAESRALFSAIVQFFAQCIVVVHTTSSNHYFANSPTF